MGFSGASDLKPCPPVVPYSESFNARLIAEIEALPPDAALIEAISDYWVMRRQCE